MHKSRPQGVTIFAYWALVGSGIMFVSSAFNLSSYVFTEDAFSIARSFLSVITAPLGSGVAAINSYTALLFAAFLAILGLHTMQGRKWAWFANVGISIAALAQFGVALSSMALFTSASTGMLMFAAFIAVSVLRLYYLFRPNVRDFFDTWSIFEQKRTV